MTVTVNVQRDVVPPVFSEEEYDSFTIGENTQLGNVIHTRVRATDADMQGEIRYEVVGEMPAPVQFGVVADIGNIIVISDLRATEQNLYNVSFQNTLI